MQSQWFLSRSIIGFLLMISSRVNASGNNVVCYFINSNGYSLAPPETLDANLCTHINYAFAEIDEEGFLTYQNEKLDIDAGMYYRVTNLTAKNPSLKVLLSIESFSANLFPSVAADANKRKNFVTSSKEFIETYNFHGLDIDWEKPTANDSDNFVALLRELRTEFDQASPKWLLSAAVYPNPDAGYNVPEITKYLDMFNIMTYNYFGPWSPYTGQNAPLFESSIDSNFERTNLNVAASIKNWINAGATQHKMNAGLAFYGRAFTLANAEIHGLHANITGPGTTATPTYRQICSSYNEWTRVWDQEQKNPYKYLGDQWVGYDDEMSITEKVKYAMSQDLAGVMVWHIGGDDLNGECGEKQGLLKLVNDVIDNY
ncbi:probable chitinase 10 [Anoplophora glabripennis]|nr:probable chitinase 10 [Anoplophora glabripennis]